MVLPDIKNIIFDLGGVIINLSTEKTLHSFASLSGLSLPDIEKMMRQEGFFHQYEKGLITDEEFRNHLCKAMNLHIENDLLDRAWNAMLLDIPLRRINLLKQLRNHYKLYLLSNTNNIHLQSFNHQVLQLTGFPSLDHFFNKTYYSHLIKMRKPDVEIYEYVIQTNNLQPHETLFLDDNKDNLEGAIKVGITTFHVQHPDQLFSLF